MCNERKQVLLWSHEGCLRGWRPSQGEFTEAAVLSSKRTPGWSTNGLLKLGSHEKTLKGKVMHFLQSVGTFW